MRKALKDIGVSLDTQRSYGSVTCVREAVTFYGLKRVLHLAGQLMNPNFSIIKIVVDSIFVCVRLLLPCCLSGLLWDCNTLLKSSLPAPIGCRVCQPTNCTGLQTVVLPPVTQPCCQISATPREQLQTPGCRVCHSTQLVKVLCFPLLCSPVSQTCCQIPTHYRKPPCTSWVT